MRVLERPHTAPSSRGDGPVLALWAVVATMGIVVGGFVAARNPLFSTNAAPLHGRWELALTPAYLIPLALAALLVATGPVVAERLAWRRLLFASGLAAGSWAVALAVTVGGHGLVEPLTSRFEYLAGVPFVESIGPGQFLRTFTDAVGGYPVHVNGHPPGLVLVLWLLGAIGLGAPVWASLLVVVIGATAVPAVLIAVREVGGEARARHVAPYLVMAPAAVWIATSGDAFFTGVAAWAVTLTVLATARPGRGLAVGAGVVWTASLLLSYGLVLLAPVAALVAWKRRRLDVLFIAAATAVVGLVILGMVSGFWWPEGLLATRRAYLDGLSGVRPGWFYIWLNVSALAIALGPAVAPALRRLRNSGSSLLVAGALAGLTLANLSLLSKAEVERIWLPWVPWILVAAVAIPVARRRWWLAGQAATALSLQLVLRSPW